ncbi:MAG: trypsin-like serine protease [Sandaracinaceae bacterium]
MSNRHPNEDVRAALHVIALRVIALHVIGLLVIATGCAAEVDDVGERASAITSGWRDDGDEPVVALMRAGALLCTGTLIAPGVVLTAAHCVTPLEPQAVFFGPVLELPEDRVDVARVRAHPEYDPNTLLHDIAIVELAYDVDVTPAEIVPGAVREDRIGSEVRIVGYGLLSAGGATDLRKRSGTTYIESLDSSRFRLSGEPSQPCRGDSGGPAFLQVGSREPVVGVHSGGDASCTGGSYETRVDAHMDFLEPYLARPYSTGPGGVTPGCHAAGSAPTSPFFPFFSLLAMAIARRARRSLR